MSGNNVLKIALKSDRYLTISLTLNLQVTSTRITLTFCCLLIAARSDVFQLKVALNTINPNQFCTPLTYP